MGKTALRKKEKVRFRNVLYIKYNILKDFKRNLEFCFTFQCIFKKYAYDSLRMKP